MRELGDLWRWLIDAADRERDIGTLFGGFCPELVGRGFPISRGSLGLEVLHPEVSGSQFMWTDASAVTVAEFARAGVVQSPSYRNSPARIVDETDRPLRRRLDAPCPDLPLLEELRLGGATDYLMLPLPFLDRSRTATMAFATRRAGGFTEAELADLAMAARLFSPYAERYVLQRIAVDLLDIYVGPRTGGRIIAGSIERGSFERIEAAVWFADLRGFTQMTESAPVVDVIARLDAWFEAMVTVIDTHGGEVLKFIGDAVLAIFPTSPARGSERVCADALAAALSFAGGAAARSEAGGPGFALALHFGEVAYGNVGGARRLDFTVIGPAVNRAARLQDLAKSLGRPILASETFAETLGRRLPELGTHKLRGVADPQRVFGIGDA